jgi:cell division septation protein DedD
MATAQVPDRRSRYAEALIFWVATLLVCAVAGYGSYRYGRSWIGDRLGDEVKPVLTTDDLTSRITPKAFERSASADSETDSEQPPPEEAVVQVKPVSVAADDRARLAADERATGKAAGADEESEADDSDTEDADAADGAASTATRPAESRRTASTEPEPARRTETRDADDEGARYVVRAGAFKSRANADRRMQELREKGYKPYLSTVVKDGEEFTRVNVATYGSRDEALQLRGELRGEGYSDASVSNE